MEALIDIINYKSGKFLLRSAKVKTSIVISGASILKGTPGEETSVLKGTPGEEASILRDSR